MVVQSVQQTPTVSTLRFLKLVDLIINTITLVDMELAGLGNSVPQNGDTLYFLKARETI